MQAASGLFAAIAGLLSATQAGSNSTLARTIGPYVAGLVSLAVSATALLLAGALSGRLAWPAPDRIAAVPWWAWLGGLMGATLVAAQLFVAQRLGSAVFIAITVSASVATSLALDHYGLMGFPQHPATWPRLAGLALMIAGVATIARY